MFLRWFFGCSPHRWLAEVIHLCPSRLGWPRLNRGWSFEWRHVQGDRRRIPGPRGTLRQLVITDPKRMLGTRAVPYCWLSESSKYVDFCDSLGLRETKHVTSDKYACGFRISSWFDIVHPKHVSSNPRSSGYLCFRFFDFYLPVRSSTASGWLDRVKVHLRGCPFQK